jgi:hypothetical protein
MADIYAEYVAAANAYYARDDAVKPDRATFCPECGEDQPKGNDHPWADLHSYADNGVLLIGCDGYFVQDPAVFDIESSNWQDWRDDV